MSHHELLKGRYSSNIPGCLISDRMQPEAAPLAGRLYEQLLKIKRKASDQSRYFPPHKTGRHFDISHANTKTEIKLVHMNIEFYSGVLLFIHFPELLSLQIIFCF